MAPPQDPAENRRHGLFVDVHALIDRGDPRFTLVATMNESARALVWFASVTRSSVWNKQRHSSIDAIQDRDGLDARARARGCELRFILPGRSCSAGTRSPRATTGTCVWRRSRTR